MVPPPPEVKKSWTISANKGMLPGTGHLVASSSCWQWTWFLGGGGGQHFKDLGQGTTEHLGEACGHPSRASQ